MTMNKPAQTDKITKANNKGRILQIMGPVVDVEFGENLPEIYGALNVATDGGNLVLEVQQDLGWNTVRTIAMGPTEGLKRGMDAVDTGPPIMVPVGPETLE